MVAFNKIPVGKLSLNEIIRKGKLDTAILARKASNRATQFLRL